MTSSPSSSHSPPGTAATLPAQGHEQEHEQGRGQGQRCEQEHAQAGARATASALDRLAMQARGDRSDRNWASGTLRACLELLAGQPVAARHSAESAWPLVRDLMPLADHETLDLLAALVLTRPETPADIVRDVIARGGDGAARLVAGLRDLPAPQRKQIAQDSDPRLAAALAVRADLTRADCLALAARDEISTWRVLLGNRAVTLPGPVQRDAIARARQRARGDEHGLHQPMGDGRPENTTPLPAATGNADLAHLLLARARPTGPEAPPRESRAGHGPAHHDNAPVTDIDPADLAILYPWADACQRASLRQAVVERFVERGPALGVTLSPKACDAVLEAARLGLDTLEAVVTDLLCTPVPGSPAPWLDPALLQCALRHDPSRETLALAMTALGLPAEHATRALLRLGDDVARDTRRLTGLVEMMRELGPASGAAIVQAICARNDDALSHAHATPATASTAVMGRAGTASGRAVHAQAQRPEDSHAAVPKRGSRSQHVPVMADGGLRTRQGAVVQTTIRPAASPATGPGTSAIASTATGHVSRPAPTQRDDNRSRS